MLVGSGFQPAAGLRPDVLARLHTGGGRSAAPRERSERDRFMLEFSPCELRPEYWDRFSYLRLLCGHRGELRLDRARLGARDEHGPGQVQDAKGILMYWHPAFVGTYTRFLAALSAHLNALPYRSSILGIRPITTGSAQSIPMFPSPIRRL